MPRRSFSSLLCLFVLVAPAAVVRAQALKGLRDIPPLPASDMFVLNINSLLVKLSKPDGTCWDTPCKVSEGVSKGLATVSEQATALLMAERKGGGLAAAAAAVGVPWLAGIYSERKGPPDVLVTVEQNGVQVATQPGESHDNFNPTWTNFKTSPVHLGRGSQVYVVAVDVDLGSPDPIGQCIIIGPPQIDEAGFVKPESIRCQAGLAAISVQAERVGAPVAGTLARIPVSGQLQPLPRPTTAPTATAPLPREFKSILRRPTPAAATAPMDPIDQALNEIAASVPPGATPLTDVFRGRLGANTSAGLPIVLAAGSCYWIAGAGGPGTSPLYLSLRLLTMQATPPPLLASSYVDDARPILGGDPRICPTTTGIYRITVGTKSTGGEYGVVAYRLPVRRLVRVPASLR
jgi:hypothetical protein